MVLELQNEIYFFKFQGIKAVHLKEKVEDNFIPFEKV